MKELSIFQIIYWNQTEKIRKLYGRPENVDINDLRNKFQGKFDVLLNLYVQDKWTEKVIEIVEKKLKALWITSLKGVKQNRANLDISSKIDLTIIEL
ncbi:MAG: hypothetical protein ACD_4C00344G0010 [uncultured bacterium (gcode 4)]|uniref:Uncharacterized protein n=1 Tax=uncultured bacterium (gcode 4) TaxID=1234023 RepID=K2GSK1_9BACT|nr:MAG: hypothetical protein ACD_4C00344G0010 [uncultured bacterium (gcode 4)]